MLPMCEQNTIGEFRRRIQGLSRRCMPTWICSLLALPLLLRSKKALKLNLLRIEWIALRLKILCSTGMVTQASAEKPTHPTRNCHYLTPLQSWWIRWESGEDNDEWSLQKDLPTMFVGARWQMGREKIKDPRKKWSITIFLLSVLFCLEIPEHPVLADKIYLSVCIKFASYVLEKICNMC
jgi:hypothetical protein